MWITIGSTSSLSVPLDRDGAQGLDGNPSQTPRAGTLPTPVAHRGRVSVDGGSRGGGDETLGEGPRREPPVDEVQSRGPTTTPGP